MVLKEANKVRQKAQPGDVLPIRAGMPKKLRTKPGALLRLRKEHVAGAGNTYVGVEEGT